MQEQLERIANTLSGIEECTGCSDYTGDLQSIDSTLNSIADAISGMGSAHRLDLERVRVFVVEPLLQPRIREATCTTRGTTEVRFISAVTMDVERDDRPELLDGVAFLAPMQWALLRGAHPLEVKRYFGRSDWKDMGADTQRGHLTVKYRVTDIRKSNPRPDETVLELHWEFTLPLQFYYPECPPCQAALTENVLDETKPFGGMHSYCDSVARQCRTCSRVLTCWNHYRSQVCCPEHPEPVGVK